MIGFRSCVARFQFTSNTQVFGTSGSPFFEMLKLSQLKPKIFVTLAGERISLAWFIIGEAKLKKSYCVLTVPRLTGERPGVALTRMPSLSTCAEAAISWPETFRLLSRRFGKW